MPVDLDRSIPILSTRYTQHLRGGNGIFAFPHPLHNTFGIYELIGYRAPLALALSWGKGS